MLFLNAPPFKYWCWLCWGTVTNLRTWSICQPQGNISTADNDVAACGRSHNINQSRAQTLALVSPSAPTTLSWLIDNYIPTQLTVITAQPMRGQDEITWWLSSQSEASVHCGPVWMSSQPPSQAGNDNLRQCKKLNYHLSSIILLWLESIDMVTWKVWKSWRVNSVSWVLHEEFDQVTVLTHYCLLKISFCLSPIYPWKFLNKSLAGYFSQKELI